MLGKRVKEVSVTRERTDLYLNKLCSLGEILPTKLPVYKREYKAFSPGR